MCPCDRQAAPARLALPLGEEFDLGVQKDRLGFGLDGPARHPDALAGLVRLGSDEHPPEALEGVAVLCVAMLVSRRNMNILK